MSALPNTSQKQENMKRILVVDDDESHRRTICDILLTCPDYQCTTAGDGRAALALLEQSPHHLVITDLVMPNMSGLALLQQMEKRGFLNDIPVIMVTSEVNYEVDRYAKKTGACVVLKKPVDPATLHQVVAQALEKGK